MLEILALLALIIGIPIVALYLGLRFWRVWLSILAAAVLGVAIFQAYSAYRSHTAEQDIAEAQAEPEPQTWQVRNEPDPATGVLRPRSAYVWSDDGLCVLEVEERLDKDRLTEISCPDLPIQFNYRNKFIERFIEDYTQVGVKFDTMKASSTIAIARFNNVDNDESVYTSSDQDGHGHLKYDDFVRRIASSGKLALELEFKYGGRHWIRFSLGGSRAALERIGAVPKVPARRRVGEPNALDQILDEII